MSKTIRITALLAIILRAIFVVVGQLILPIILLLVLGTGLNSEAADLFAGLGAYLGVHVIDFVYSAIFVLMCVLTILAARSRDDRITVEIIGLIVIGAVIPILSLISGTLTTLFVARSIISVSSKAYANYAELNSYSLILNILNSVALILYVFATATSVCRKKWARDDEFEKEISD